MPSKINEKSTHTETDHWVVSEHRDKEKGSRNKPPPTTCPSPEKKSHIQMTADFSIAKLDIEDRSNIFKILRENHFQPVIHSPAKYQLNVKVKIISDTWGLKFTSCVIS